MRTFRTLTLAAVLLVALSASSAFAQTTLSSTTLAAAATATATQVSVASATGIEVGDYLAVVANRRIAELMTVRAINGTFLTVSRGVQFPAVAHLSGATLYHAPPAQFYTTDPVQGSACTSTSELYLPHINRTSRTVSQCSTGGVWYALDSQFTVQCYALLVADMVDQTCWHADGDYVVTGIRTVHKVSESAGTLTLIPKRQQSTEAPASGDVLGTALTMIATAETVRSYTLTTTGTDLLLDAGDRLGLDFTDDTAGELAGVSVTFTLAPR
jgi:hypothetical protein